MTSDSTVQIAQDICAPTLVHRVAALLDRDTAKLKEGDPMPRGWHVALFTASTPQTELRPDGVGGLGFTLPPSDLPRMVMGGKRTRFLGDIPIGSRVERESRTSSIVDKVGRSGPMRLMTVLHQVRVKGAKDFALEEEQDYIMLSAAGTEAGKYPPERQGRKTAERFCNVVFDETMVFRYSAITFNAHRIHFDKDYTRDAEGYPGLLVNGGLSALFLIELAKGLSENPPSHFALRNTAPLFCNTPARLCANRSDRGWTLWIDDETGQSYSSADVEFATLDTTHSE